MSRPADWHPAIIASVARAYGRVNGMPPVYWEIGVHKGDCLREVAPHCRLTVAVDVDLSPCDPEEFSALGSVVFYEGLSDEFFARQGQEWALHARPDLIFIDADHSAEAAGSDFENALSFLAADGTIFMHDTWPTLHEDTDQRICGTVHRVPPSLALDPTLSVWTIPLFPGLTAVSRRALPPVMR